MTRVRASAPGKAVLFGEYVVLEGAPAVCVALNRRVLVTVSENNRNVHCVTAPGFVQGEHCFECCFDDSDSALLRWQDPADADVFALFDIIWRKFAPNMRSGLSVCVDSSRFSADQNDQKLGLGSSAAVAVGLAAALNAHSSGSFNMANTAADVSAAHLEFQDGHGSGADVATSLHGGVILFSNRTTTSRWPLAWPEGLVCQFMYSGKPASTVQRIKRFRSNQNSESVMQSKFDLAQCAEALATSWAAGDVRDILPMLRKYVDVLSRFSDEFGLDVFAAGHAEMVRLASKYDIVYKPCGAGGGDIGVAFSVDEVLLKNFCNKAHSLGFESMDVIPDWQGVRIETEF